MITNREKWHYITIKSISGLFRRITSNNNGDFYCLNCFHSYRTENALKKHELICNDHNYCKVDFPSEKNKILSYSQGSYSLQMAHVIYGDIESLLANRKTCSNNPDKSSSQTITTHVPCGYSINVVNEFKANYHTYYRRQDCVEKLSKELLKIGKGIANEEEHDMKPLINDEKKQYEESKECHICKKAFNTDKKSKYYKNFKKVKDHCY